MTGMDQFFWLVGCSSVVFFIISFLLIYFGDCDILLQFYSQLGQPTACLKGKVVWITGASSGIGEHIAYELAKVGAKLVLSARREEELERVKKKCIEFGSSKDNVLVLKLDVTDFKNHPLFVGTVLKYFKKIDILINNAGATQVARWTHTSLDVDMEMVKLNTFGPVSLTKHVIPHMIANRNGHIVNMNSFAGKFGAPLSGSYSGSKHALEGWFKSLRIEELPRNIRVTSIHPGIVYSRILENAFGEKKGKGYTGSMNPSKDTVSLERCAYLSTVAIANDVNEAWIANHPVLLYIYLHQYFPNLGYFISKFIWIEYKDQ